MSKVSFNLRMISKPLDSGKHPIEILISWREGGKSNSRRKHLGVECYPYEWDEDKRRLSSRGSSKLNEQLANELHRARQIYETHFEGKRWVYDNLVRLFDTNKSETILVSWALSYIEDFELRGQIGSADRHKNTLDAFRKFMGKQL